MKKGRAVEFEKPAVELMAFFEPNQRTLHF